MGSGKFDETPLQLVLKCCSFIFCALRDTARSPLKRLRWVGGLVVIPSARISTGEQRCVDAQLHGVHDNYDYCLVYPLCVIELLARAFDSTTAAV